MFSVQGMGKQVRFCVDSIAVSVFVVFLVEFDKY